MVNKEQFREATGRDPEHDDLERVNCNKAGTLGHLSCGWCKHERPVFECNECRDEQYRKAFEPIGL